MEDKTLRVMKFVAENFKSLDMVELRDLGSSVVLEGKNGAGKTQILQALQASLEGKTGLPEGSLSECVGDPKKESSIITMEVGDGQTVHFTTRVRITESNFDLQIKKVGPEGKLIAVTKPVEFLKTIVGAVTFRPQMWRRKKDAELLEEFFSFFPELKKLLSENSTKISILEQDRASKLNQLKVLRVDLERTVFTPGMPEKEIDPVDLMKKLTKAQEHNKEFEILKQTMFTNQSVVDVKNVRIDSLKDEISRKESDIAKLQKEIAEANASIELLAAQKEDALEEIESAQTAIDMFVPEEIQSIQTEVSQVNVNNEAIRKNLSRKSIETIIESVGIEANNTWNKIKTAEEERNKAMQSIEMPIEGLQIGDGCLLYPNSKMSMVRLSQLSDGESWPVIVGLHSAFKPRLKIMIVDDLHQLDEDNQKALFSEAEKHGMQLWIHRTIYSPEDAGMGFLIKDGAVVNKVS